MSIYRQSTFRSQSSFLSLLVGAIFLLASHSDAWEPAKNPIWTPWGEAIDEKNVLQEYPRPQLVRGKWRNLNGIWEAKQGFENDAVPFGQSLAREILVPFPVESALSGVKEHWERIWYRKLFNVPSDWSGQKILLHFGSVDWEAEVYLNGKPIGLHKGGYDPFSFDITAYVKAENNEVIVRVYDPTDRSGIANGKQVNARFGKTQGITYTPSSGIWKTVWLEAVPNTYIKDLKLVPDIDAEKVRITVNTNSVSSDFRVTLTAFNGLNEIAKANISPNEQFALSIPDPRLWSPDNPFLYDLKVSLVDESGKTVDSISSYFGMRKISLGKERGITKILLNNKFVFQMGPLDQGFWPDGLYTAPSDAALKFDIEQTKAMGFNMIRKHGKVEPDRWYYWADKLGLLVWQDMPSPVQFDGPNEDFKGNGRTTSDGQPTPSHIDTIEEKLQFETELTSMVKNNWNHPSIIMWVVWNEQWGMYDQERLTKTVMTLDQSRLVNGNSACCIGRDDIDGEEGSKVGSVGGHVNDYHYYKKLGPYTPASQTDRAIVNGEYGGLFYKIDGHVWDPNYVSRWFLEMRDGQHLTEVYETYNHRLIGLRDKLGLSAAVFTQLTDVEGELNGLLTYDRRVVKADFGRIKIANEQTYRRFNHIVPTSENVPQIWKYTTTLPHSAWFYKSFDDTRWANGAGGFGTAGTPGVVIRTTWDTNDIWLRKIFNPGQLRQEQLDNLVLRLTHDEEADIYINGVLAKSVRGFSTDYFYAQISQTAKNAIVMNGENVIAVHCHQTTGGQAIDVGLAIREKQNWR